MSILCGCGRLITGNLEEIGERSAVVLVDKPIRRNSQVNIHCEAYNLRGIVQSCQFAEMLGYLVEVTLDIDSSWSPKWFTPKHLMCLLERPAVRRFA